jgi:hypothetical protein
MRFVIDSPEAKEHAMDIITKFWASNKQVAI